MRIRVLAVLVFAVAVTLTLSLIRGQERPAASASPASPTVATPATDLPAVITPAAKPANDRLDKLNDFQKQTLLAAQRGADWMFRMHGVKGRFLNGYVPALRQEVEGDHFARQAAAAFALGRAARYTGEARYAARATQAVLALVEDTVPDESDATCRHTALPSSLLNRVGAAGLLILAINELPAPQKDLLEKSEQLCNYVRKQARTDGSLAYSGPESKGESAGVNVYPGAALAGIALSQRHRPADWKSDLVKKALPYYREWWKKNRSPAFVASMSPAFSETHARTKDKACAEFVCEMNDWVCTLQYTNVEPRRLQWHGGMMDWQDNRAVESAPTVASAAQAGSLAEACRVARELADVTRYDRYSQALDSSLRFLATLQYSEAGTQHFAEWYRPRLVGAFHHSHQDGNLRLDDTACAVAALYGYLEHAAR